MRPMAFSGYLAKWVTKKKLAVYGFWIKKELHSLTEDLLDETVEVLTILVGMVKDEVNERTPANV